MEGQREERCCDTENKRPTSAVSKKLLGTNKGIGDTRAGSGGPEKVCQSHYTVEGVHCNILV